MLSMFENQKVKNKKLQATCKRANLSSELGHFVLTHKQSASRGFCIQAIDNARFVPYSSVYLFPSLFFVLNTAAKKKS